jgi:predicted transcriptional regulator YdeE
MDSFILGEDIKVICVTATSFPDGVERAHIQLHAILQEKERRRFFGISRSNENGEIIYKAAAEELEPGEAMGHGLETFIIKKGPYNSFFIKDFMQDIGSIKRAFKLLIAQHEVDPNGYCFEWYIGDNDVKCMVPLGPEYQDYTGLNKE